MADTSEARLIEKLRAIEALHARPGTSGERQAAANARERILQRLAEMSREDVPIEYRFSMPDMWSRRVFVALLRRYGIRPYRYRRQRYTTVMAKVSQRFVDETLWPQYEAFSNSLREYLADVTDRVVSQVIHDDLTEARVVEEPPQLSLAIDGHDKAATVAIADNTQTGETTKRAPASATARTCSGSSTVPAPTRRSGRRENSPIRSRAPGVVRVNSTTRKPADTAASMAPAAASSKGVRRMAEARVRPRISTTCAAVTASSDG